MSYGYLTENIGVLILDQEGLAIVLVFSYY
jgi:hypothetical protein